MTSDQETKEEVKTIIYLKTMWVKRGHLNWCVCDIQAVEKNPIRERLFTKCCLWIRHLTVLLLEGQSFPSLNIIRSMYSMSMKRSLNVYMTLKCICSCWPFQVTLFAIRLFHTKGYKAVDRIKGLMLNKTLTQQDWIVSFFFPPHR